MSVTFSLTEVSTHDAQGDLFLVIHDKVYDVSKFVDQHPGGEQVLLELAGGDATEPFQDVGHSDEACEILSSLLIGRLQSVENFASKKAHTSPSDGAESMAATRHSIGLYLAIGLAVAIAFLAYYLTRSA